MTNIFDDNDIESFPVKEDPEDFDENEAAKLATLHEGDILNEDGSIYREPDGYDLDEESDDINI
jgi:alkyl sulfatase BDS1-like metallo-beta-lactamase superfamily hydrolase